MRLQAGPVGLDEDAGHAHPFPRELLERLEARCGRNDDEETAVPQRPERAGGGLAADEVEHDVDVANGLLDRAEAVVDRLVGAQLGEEPVLGRAGRADHVRTARLRDLHGEMADATGGSQHEHALSGLNVGCLHQRLPRRQSGERKRGGLDVGQPLGCAGELARGRSHVLRVGGCFTGEARHSEDPVSHGESRDAEAQSLHRAGDVPADGERRLAEEAAAQAHLPVHGVDAGGGHAHEHLRRRRLGLRSVDELEHLRPAERLLGDRAHAQWCCIQGRQVAPTYTRPLEELRRSDAAEFGGKSASLGELLSAGLRVPPGFAISAKAFAKFIEETGLAGTIEAALARVYPGNVDTIDAASKTIGEAMRFAPLPDDLRAELVARYDALAAATGEEWPPVAVRSSALGEDSEEASHAGQQESFLWVCGPEQVCDAVRDCWVSLYTPHAISYRAALGGDAETAMGVAVQLMVDAEVSGVMFTCNPVSGDPSMVAVNASWGLGIAVVSGELTPDDYLVSKVTGEVVRRTVSEKGFEYVPDAAGRGTVRRRGAGGTTRRAVPGSRRARRAGRSRAPHRGALREPSGRRVGDRAWEGSAREPDRPPGAPGDDAARAIRRPARPRRYRS